MPLWLHVVIDMFGVWVVAVIMYGYFKVKRERERMERLADDFAERLKPAEKRYFVRAEDGTAVRVDSLSDVVGAPRGMGYVEARDSVGETTISTIFLGLDHQFGEGPPLLWETALLRPEGTSVIGRYSTLADALGAHKALLHTETACHGQD